MTQEEKTALDAKIAELKAAGTEVFELAIEHEGETLIGYVKHPNDAVKDMAVNSFMTTMNLLEAGKSVLKNCWVGGDAALIENADLKRSVAMQLSNLLGLKFVELKKL